MREKFRDSIFYIGLIIFSLTIFMEHLWLGETNFTLFLKGFGCAFEILGAFILIRKRDQK